MQWIGQLPGSASSMNRKLSDDDVRAIRQRLASGSSRAWLAAEYGLATETVAKIARRDTFRHVRDLPDASELDREAQARLERLAGLGLMAEVTVATQVTKSPEPGEDRPPAEPSPEPEASPDSEASGSGRTKPCVPGQETGVVPDLPKSKAHSMLEWLLREER